MSGISPQSTAKTIIFVKLVATLKSASTAKTAIRTLQSSIVECIKFRKANARSGYVTSVIRNMRVKRSNVNHKSVISRQNGSKPTKSMKTLMMRTLDSSVTSVLRWFKSYLNIKKSLTAKVTSLAGKNLANRMELNISRSKL